MMKQSLWALAAAALFSFMAVFVKLCSGHFGSLELVFYRSLIGIVTIGLFVRSQGLSLRTPYLGGHIKRAVLGTASVGLWFFTIGQMPLGTNMTLIYTTPLFMAANFIILAFMRKEAAPWGVVLAILFGFTGVTTVLQPSFEAGYMWPALTCLFVAFIDLIVYWQIKQLGSLKEPSWRIVFYFSMFGAVFGVLGSYILEDGMHMPTMESGAYLIGMGICATLGQICTTRSYAYGNMLLSSCLGFSAIPFSALVSFILFGENVPPLGLLGMMMIIVAGIFATIYTKRTEAQNRAKEQRA
ncbi:MAG TPA: DMT family transporter [Candidatus Aphodousia faecipullorum]|nr:DMT family transporter [Candidatus Aphodousia faecipullorum]